MNQQKQPKRWNLVIEFIIPKFIEGSIWFERHTSNHQELQTVFAASGLFTHVMTGRCPGWVETAFITCVYKPETANTVWSSWWWAVCRSKHVEPSINFGIINSITKLHLVGYFYWFILRCTDPWISNPRILNFGNRYMWVSVFTSRLLYLRLRNLFPHYIRGWASHRAGLDFFWEKKPYTSVGNQRSISVSFSS